jgi:CxxC-x17-CxxC domain-containing protein
MRSDTPPKRAPRTKNSGRFGARDSGPFTSNRNFDKYGRKKSPASFKATCSECGKECDLPFKPQTDKPVYCSDCFKRVPRRGKGDELAGINEKLDKIMKALKIE